MPLSKYILPPNDEDGGVENIVDEDDLHYLDHEISLQDLEQQLLLELRDPVGTMAVHRQLVEVQYQHVDDRVYYVLHFK